jgi:phosphoserine phosphatase
MKEAGETLPAEKWEGRAGCEVASLTSMDAVVGRVLATADDLRREVPAAVPVAFWDFDGTLLEGDCVDGYRRGDGAGYAGLMERMILAGLCPAYAGAAGVARCEREVVERKQRDGRGLAYAFQTQIFGGVAEAEIRALARLAFEREIGDWLFAEALAGWRRLEAAGVRCWVISASADFFVKEAAARLGVGEERCVGMRVRRAADGRLSDALEGPLLFGAGKAERMRELLAGMAAAEPERVFLPVAGFGNDPESDGPMLEAVCQTVLPAGRSVGVLVNVPAPAARGGVVHVPCRPRPAG